MYPINETLSVNESLTVEGRGRYFEITDLIGSVEVILMTRDGERVAYGKDVLIGTFFNTNKPFDSIIITNTSGAETTIKSFFGDGQAGSKRIGGAVSIAGVPSFIAADVADINTAAYRFSLNGKNYSQMGFVSANAGLISGVALYNPPASGKLLFVNSLRITSTTAGNIDARVALIFGTLPVSFSTVNRKRLLTGPISVAETRVQLGVGINPPHDTYSIERNWQKLAMPYVVGPDQSMLVANIIDNANLQVEFGYYER